MAVAPPKASQIKPTDLALSQLDNFWLRSDEPKNPMIIHFCVKLDHDVPLKELTDKIKVWTDMYPRFQSLVVTKGWNKREWQRVPNFDPLAMKCCSEVRLPAATEAAVFGFIDSCINQPLFPENTVLWRMFKATNVPWGGCILMWRVHHCICDGVSLTYAMQKFFGEKSPDENRPLSPAYIPSKDTPSSPFSPRIGPQSGSSAAGGSKANLTNVSFAVAGAGIFTTLGTQFFGMGGKGNRPGVIAALGAVGAIFPAVAKFTYVYGNKLLQAFIAAAALRIPDSRTSLKNPLTGKRHTGVIGDLISVESVKKVTSAVTNRMGERYTVNDVLCGMLSGAFRRYLLQTGQNPRWTTMRMVLPVNMRMPWEDVNVENRFATVFVRLPLAKTSSVDRLKYVHSCMVDFKASWVPQSEVYLLRGLGLLPNWLFRTLVNFNCIGGSMVVTNVNANATPLRLASAKVTESMAWVPAAGGIGVGISLITYNNKVSIGLIADVNLIPDLNLLKQCIREEWQSFVQEYTAQSDRSYIEVSQPEEVSWITLSIEIIEIWQLLSVF